MCSCVQLVLSLVQTMHVPVVGYPPQTTNFPPGRRETLGTLLESGKSGIEHVFVGAVGKISTEERGLPPSQPPTTNCPDVKLIKKTKPLRSKDEESIMKTCFLVLTFAFAWNRKEKQKDEDTGSHDY